MTSPFGTPGTEDDDDFSVDGLDEVSSFYVPPNKYRAKVIELTKEVSKQGNPMWVWTFAIVHGDQSGKELKVWTALTAAALWKLVEVLDALKLGHVDGKAKFKKNDVINKECYIVVEDSEYNGRKTSTISQCEVI